MLQLTPTHAGPLTVEAKVAHVFSPFTMSSAMKVTLTPQSDTTSTTLPDEAVLKVYDRRFADDMRKQHEINPPTSEVEALYAQYLASGNVAETEEQFLALVEELPEDCSEENEVSRVLQQELCS